jgi:putative ABC transport system substrate-binding protein
MMQRSSRNDVEYRGRGGNPRGRHDHAGDRYWITSSAVANSVGLRCGPAPPGREYHRLHQPASLAGKWLELLTEIAPAVKRVTAMFNPDTAPGGGSYYLPTFEAAARSSKVEAVVAPVHGNAEIETTITSLGHEPGSGLVIMPDGSFNTIHRAPIILLAAQNNVPTVYYASYFARDGGLLSYGPDRADIYRRSAAYVDRILRGAKPVDLPVQLPTKFEMAINLKTAKALGLTVPQSILLSADEVIE